MFLKNRKTKEELSTKYKDFSKLLSILLKKYLNPPHFCVQKKAFASNATNQSTFIINLSSSVIFLRNNSLPIISTPKVRIKNILVLRLPGSVFLSTPDWLGKKLSFSDGKDSINPYLPNLIFELFPPLYFACLLLLQCAGYHYKFRK